MDPSEAAQRDLADVVCEAVGPCTFIDESDGASDPNVTGLRVVATDSFLHDAGTSRLRSLLQWHNPLLLSPEDIHCGIYARSYNNDGTGIYDSLGRERVGLTFVTRNAATEREALNLTHEGNVGIGHQHYPASANRLSISGNFEIVGTVMTGTLDAARVTGTLSSSLVPQLDVSKITTGTFAAARIPVIPHAKVSSGTFDVTRIPSLDAAKITTGTFASDHVPSIATSKFTSGTITTSQVGTVDPWKITSGAFPRFIDQRQLKPSDIAASSWTVGFGSWSHNNTTPWADILHLNTASTGNVNALVFSRNHIGMRVWQGAQGSGTTYSTFKEALLSNTENGSVSVTCTDNSVSSFEVELPQTVDASWRTFKVHGAAYWGDSASLNITMTKAAYTTWINGLTTVNYGGVTAPVVNLGSGYMALTLPPGGLAAIRMTTSDYFFQYDLRMWGTPYNNQYGVSSGTSRIIQHAMPSQTKFNEMIENNITLLALTQRGSTLSSFSSVNRNGYTSLADPSAYPAWTYYVIYFDPVISAPVLYCCNPIGTLTLNTYYIDKILHATVEPIMFRNPHAVYVGGHGKATVRFGRAGGVPTGRWWEIACLSDGQFHISPEGGGSNRVLISTVGGVTASGDITVTSDARLKTNVVTISASLEKLCSLRGVTFTKDGRRGMGVIAQEVRDIFPDAVEEEDGEDKWLSVSYSSIIAPLIEALKEEQRALERLKAIVESWR